MQQNDSPPEKNEKSSGNHEKNEEQVKEHHQIGEDSIKHLQAGLSPEVAVDRSAIRFASELLQLTVAKSRFFTTSDIRHKSTMLFDYKKRTMTAEQHCHGLFFIPYRLISSPVYLCLLPSVSIAMVVPPVITVMTPPAPVPTYRSGHLSISAVPPVNPYNLLPANLGRVMARPVLIMMIIPMVVRKNHRWQRRERKKYPVDPSPLRLAPYSHCTNHKNRRYCHLHLVYYLHGKFLLMV